MLSIAVMFCKLSLKPFTLIDYGYILLTIKGKNAKNIIIMLEVVDKFS